MTAATVASRASRNGAAGSRFRPSRGGVINLWDYRDEEFVFADGRLVLRGPNGSGKTKALEVLFPFVLDGRIEPRRLNPFASEDRTMKSNLLFRGQQSSYGYVWMEFAAATGEVVTVGIGLQARKHVDKVKRWYFVVDGRVGVDFSLLTTDERPLTRGQLIAEIGADAVRDNPGEHRAAVDARLFALGRERFEQLLTLVLTLRRPQLAKNLDPVKLSDTLSDGLRPLDDHLLAEAARSFDDMEAVARTLEGLARADEAAAGFLTAYTTYLRSHARVAADAVTARRSAVTNRAGELAAASARLLSAQTGRGEAGRRLHEAELSLHTLRAQLDQLKRSDAYQAHEQLADLQRLVAELRESCASAQRRRAERTAARERAETHLVRARVRVVELEAEAGRVAGELAADAADAGIGWDVDAAASAGFAERVVARTAARHDDVQTVRAALGELGRAEHARRSAAAAAERAEAAVGAAVDVEQQAAREVAASRSAARQRLADWADRHAATVAELGVSDLLEALAGTIESAGEADATDPRTAFHRATTEAVQLRRDELAGLRQQRATVADEIADLERQQREIAAERDDSPTPFAARTADRASRAGAPLWQLVRFAEQLDEADAAGLEAALEAANLLDAWIHPDDADTAAAVAAGDADGYLTPLPVGARPAGRTLGSVLAAEDTDLVDPARVCDVLASIALLDRVDQPAPGGPPSVSASGRFGQGVQIGAFRKPLAGYIGATARARRRAARLAELDRSLADATARLDATDRLVSWARSVLDAVEAAAAELPRLGAIVEALRRHDRAAGMLRATRESADAARSALDQAVAEVGARDRQLRRAAAERALDPDVIDDVAGALVRFERGAQRLTGVRRESAVAATTVEQETERVEQAQLDEERSVGDAERAEVRAAEETERLDVLQRTAGAAAAEVLALVARTEAGIGSAEQARSEAAEAREQAAEAAARADAQVDAAATALRMARAEEQAEARRLAPFAEADVLRLLRCPPQLHWPPRREDWPDPEPAADGTADSLPAAVIALHEAILAATSELQPHRGVGSSRARPGWPGPSTSCQAQLSAAGHDYRPEWDSDDGVIIVRVADEQRPGAGRRVRRAHRQRPAGTRSSCSPSPSGGSSRMRCSPSWPGRSTSAPIDARDLIGRMNTEMRRAPDVLRASPSACGWELADGLPDEHRGVCRLLERDAGRLGPDELARHAGALRRQHQGGPRRQHRTGPTGSCSAEVLDYRRWRVVRASPCTAPGGGEERLTRARHSQLSGGEQSVSLHLPLFAAAHAMLQLGQPARARGCSPWTRRSPGWTTTGRSELFGLAAAVRPRPVHDRVRPVGDLRRPCPARAHYDLSHSAVEHTVSALLMVWDGAGTDADLDGGLAARPRLAADPPPPGPRHRVAGRAGARRYAEPDGDRGE